MPDALPVSSIFSRHLCRPLSPTLHTPTLGPHHWMIHAKFKSGIVDNLELRSIGLWFEASSDK
jgi:hypothetical protein